MLAGHLPFIVANEEKEREEKNIILSIVFVEKNAVHLHLFT